MADKCTALVPSVVREVTFDGDVLLMAMVGTIPYVALRPVAEFLDLQWSAQFCAWRDQKRHISHEKRR